MMVSEKQRSFKDTDIISASEIGQYHYCSMSWFLQKCGYEPKSPALEHGIKKHVELGELIDYTKRSNKKSKVLATIGYILFTGAVLLLLFEVIKWLSIF